MFVRSELELRRMSRPHDAIPSELLSCRDCRTDGGPIPGASSDGTRWATRVGPLLQIAGSRLSFTKQDGLFLKAQNGPQERNAVETPPSGLRPESLWISSRSVRSRQDRFKGAREAYE